MDKKEAQKRVLQNGKPLALSKFAWGEKTKTFSSDEDDLAIDFKGVDFVNVTTGSYSTVTTGSYSTVTTGWRSTVTTGSDSTVKTGSYSTVTTGSDSTVTTGSYSTVTTGWRSTVTTGSDNTVATEWGSTVTTGSDNTVTTEWGSTVTINGENCVIVLRGGFEVIQPNEGDTIQLCPYGIKGHLVNGMKDGKPHIIADGILSEVTHQKGNIYTVINHGETKKSYLIKDGDVYAHGETIKQAQEDLQYKLADSVDASEYEGMALDTIKTPQEWAVVYRAITGACVAGMKGFMSQRNLKDEYTLQEIINETEHAFGGSEFKRFFMEG